MAETSPDAWPGGDAWSGAVLPPDWESALLVAVPEAEPAVAEHRAQLDSSARDGVPAHLTVLYPFLAPASIGDRDDVAALRAAAEAVCGHLPIATRVTAVTLMAGPAPGNLAIPPGQWRILAAFPLSAET